MFGSFCLLRNDGLLVLFEDSNEHDSLVEFRIDQVLDQSLPSDATFVPLLHWLYCLCFFQNDGLLVFVWG